MLHYVKFVAYLAAALGFGSVIAEMISEKHNSEDLSMEESKAFLPAEDGNQSLPPPVPGPSKATSAPGRQFWMAVAGNCIATVGIVFVNKHIFQDASLRHAQVAFATFHFAVTAALLYILSRPQLDWFEAMKLPITRILPLAVAMILNVVLPNASLANSSIQFYQVAKVLQTPTVALLNYTISGITISPKQVLTLVPLCIGVGIVSYFDAMPTSGTRTRETSPLGVFFALTGVLATAVYTVWIGKYLAVFKCSSQQLLLNQAPVSVILMLYVIPFSDDLTIWMRVSVSSWLLVLLSGILACGIHLSQFFIIKEAGPVSSTVVGHFKNTSIVALAWIVSQKLPTGGSVIGILLAFGGMLSYSYVTLRGARS